MPGNIGFIFCSDWTVAALYSLSPDIVLQKKLVQKYVSFEQNKSKSLISQPSKEEITNVICTFCPSDFVEDTAEHKRERRKTRG